MCYNFVIRKRQFAVQALHLNHVLMFLSRSFAFCPLFVFSVSRSLLLVHCGEP